MYRINDVFEDDIYTKYKTIIKSITYTRTNEKDVKIKIKFRRRLPFDYSNLFYLGYNNFKYDKKRSDAMPNNKK